MDTIWDIVTEYEEKMKENGLFEKKRKEQSKQWLTETLKGLVIKNLKCHPKMKELLPQMERQVMDGKLTTYKATRQLLGYLQQAS